MQRICIFLLLLPRLLCASSDLLFSEEEDPALYHHVNVISGDLTLCFQDLQIPGAVAHSLVRTYTSGDALHQASGEKSNHKGIYYSWRMEGGWELIPHAKLFYGVTGVFVSRFTLTEKNGSVLHYIPKKEGVYEPVPPETQNLSNLNARMNPQNNRLHYDNHKRVVMNLADGGMRFYKKGDEYFRLVKEVSPDQQETHYDYHKESLKSIRVTSPNKRITFSSIDFDLIEKPKDDRPFHLKVSTSVGQLLEYRSMTRKEIHYISQVDSNCRPKESTTYVSRRKGTGSRIKRFHLADRPQFEVDYHVPSSRSEENKLHSYPEKKGLSIDKVQTLRAPLGENGEWIPFAQFSYYPSHTDVRDVDRQLIRYHHESQRLNAIEYFGLQDKLAYSVKFYWEGPHLKGKVLLDGKGTPLFSKVFTYNEAGNVSKETFFGNLTGKALSSFTLKEGGVLEGAESYSRFYVYNKAHLVVEEREEHGLTFAYRYKSGTTLITSKFTQDGGQIIKREFFMYNEDNLLTSEIMDDGVNSKKDDSTGVKYRQIKSYQLHPSNGLPVEMKETYLEKGEEKLLRRIEYTYSSQNRVIAETLYDAENAFCYTIYTDYDNAGHVLSKTTPSGYTNRYSYGPQGELLSSKEEGSLQKYYSYNLARVATSCTEVDSLSHQRTTHSRYDAKGRLLHQVSPEGHTTSQRYDPFGHCVETVFASTKDACDEEYRPTLHFTYDVCGNLASTTVEGRGTSETLYNAFKKPIQEIQADGTILRHTYDLANRLIQTIYPDGTWVEYTYDVQHRKKEERIRGSQGDLLAQESWEYDTFTLLSHTKANGAKTVYTYDGARRVVAEQVEDRTLTYSYNAAGLLGKKAQGDVAHCTTYDKANRVLQQWTEDSYGRKENLTTFAYDEEGRKIGGTRLTSQGSAHDSFAYDARGRFCRHTDPLGNSTEFIYEEVLNDLGQWVVQKTTINPIGNRAIETYDALGHLVSIEKQDSKGKPVSQERFSYDRAGNKVRRLVNVYDYTTPLRQLITEWQYDLLGRVISEKEHPGKITSYAYTSRGQLGLKTLPNGISLAYSYDGLGRLLEQLSSEGTLHYRYTYEKSQDPVQIEDLVEGTSLSRSYNLFEELVEETNPYNFTFKWNYDHQGRCRDFTLPDHSMIHYAHEGAHLTAVERISSSNQKLYEHRYLDFDPNGHVTQERLLNHQELYSQRDLLERPSTQKSPWLTHSVVYGPSGLMLSQTNTLIGNKSFSYDPLNQLIREEDKTYHFDSLGNPLDCQVNAYNQILSTKEETLQYDLSGNPIERMKDDEPLSYTYDALGRLKTIRSNASLIHYSYDPLSRLVKKEENGKTTFYLYDQSQEIGTCTPDRKIAELKVLGSGDVGAAVAIELQGDVYAPLQDFCGHIIALTRRDGTLFESYPTDAFGKSTLAIQSQNPWRFSSKRQEGTLIFFGKRFYDPALGRFLTPDPAGFADGPNLYIYVLNNPLRRLDLFGLLSKAINPQPLHEFYSIEVNIQDIPERGEGMVVGYSTHTGQPQEKYVIISDSWERIQYTPEEQKEGKINILDHLHELVPKEGSLVGLVTFQNGMWNSFEDHKKSCQSIKNSLPEGPLFVGNHNPSLGLKHLGQVKRERRGKDTEITTHTLQWLTTTLNVVHPINPDLVWLHFSHSEGTLILSNAIDRMTPDQHATLEHHFYSVSFGGAKPVSTEHTLNAVNYYSKRDFITKRFARDYLNDERYHIEYVKSQAPWYEKMLFIPDHGILGRTYQITKDKTIKKIEREFDFYSP